MLRLLTHLEEELQLDLKTDNTRRRQKIELNGSPTTKGLKTYMTLYERSHNTNNLNGFSWFRNKTEITKYLLAILQRNCMGNTKC